MEGDTKARSRSWGGWCDYENVFAGNTSLWPSDKLAFHGTHRNLIARASALIVISYQLLSVYFVSFTTTKNRSSPAGPVANEFVY